MTAKVFYTQKGSDPSTIYWPPSGPSHERFVLTAASATAVRDLIGHGDGTITYPDGRLLPPVSAAGSTFVHVNG